MPRARKEESVGRANRTTLYRAFYVRGSTMRRDTKRVSVVRFAPSTFYPAISIPCLAPGLAMTDITGLWGARWLGDLLMGLNGW
jgi:hypothetical protein